MPPGVIAELPLAMLVEREFASSYVQADRVAWHKHNNEYDIILGAGVLLIDHGGISVFNG